MSKTVTLRLDDEDRVDLRYLAYAPPRTPSGLGLLLGAMPMLSRIISAGFTFLGWFSPGMPASMTVMPVGSVIR